MRKFPKYLRLSITGIFLVAIGVALQTTELRGMGYGLMAVGFLSGLLGVLIGTKNSGSSDGSK